MYSKISKIIIISVLFTLSSVSGNAALLISNYLLSSQSINSLYWFDGGFFASTMFNPFYLNFPLFLPIQSTLIVNSTDSVIINHFQRPEFLERPQFQRNSYFGNDFGSQNSLEPKNIVNRRKMDSSGTNFRTVEQFDSTEISYPYSVTLDEYTKLRQAQLRQQIWDSLLTRYDLKQALSQGDLARLIGQSTGLTIPIPPNPVMSIFGKPEISINVNGEVNVRLGWRWDSQNLGTVSQFGQTQSSPMFDQDIRLNVSAKIGDKLKLGTDWNTRRTFDLDNKFKIGYEGYDDDIVKLLEVGNVNLPLPTTLIRGGETLFGVRADFQFGPLLLKSLFSQKRGETKFVDVQGGVSKQYFSLKAYDYAKNHFFIDEAYIALYDEYFKNSTPVIPSSKTADYLRVKEIEVWESSNVVTEQATSGGTSIANSNLRAIKPFDKVNPEKYHDSDKTRQIITGFVERGNFIKLDSTKYRADLNLGTVTIRNLRQDRYYAVSYRIEGPDRNTIDDDLCYGSLTSMPGGGSKDTLILKLIYSPNMQPGFKTIWKRQMKNVYDINSRNVNINDTRINIWYVNKSNDSTDVLEGAPDKLVTIFGVDQVNNSTGAPPADGLFDLRPPFFDPLEGTITFPSTRPFDTLLYRYFSKPEVGNPDLASLYTFSDCYDTTYNVARLNTARDRFFITGEVSGRATNRIQLGAFNLARNSVRVTLDGAQLIENQDYQIDYFAGTLMLMNERAKLPNANLKIEYEQRDVFNISTRTLAGIRGDYQLYKSRTALANFGFTMMYYDQSAIIDRVQLGEEPVSNTMIGLDGSFDWQTQWITEALDYLPFYDTKAPSSFNMKGEWAMMLPTPNKRASEIASDNGEPVVFIDDFEGGQRNIPLGTQSSQWQHSSAPVESTKWLDALTANNYKGKLYWFQYFIPQIPVTDVYPKNNSYIQGRNKLPAMNFIFVPNERGIYNKNPEFLDENNAPNFDPLNRYSNRDSVKNRVWGGMQRLLSSFNTDFDSENIEYVEIMMQVDDFEPNAKMYIDFGKISEDIIPNGVLNTEDGITAASKVPNGIIDAGEDIGIDALDNAAEKLNYPFPLNQEADPARDDYYFDFAKNDVDRSEADFSKYNNFEGNSQYAELGQFPDTEVLNSNNATSINTGNEYFSYEIKLSRNKAEALDNPQIVGGNYDKGWFLYRIPVRKPVSQVGNPAFSNIQYVRVRFQGGFIKGKIVDWKLVGSQWQKVSNLQSNVNPKDSTLSVSFVNMWENAGSPDFYEKPPGVSAPKQLNNPDPSQDIRLNEQSIAVGVKNLRYGDERMTTKIFRPLDLFYYKKLKFFIHGDGSMPDNMVTGAIPKAYAFVRFGIDSSNYYEYRRPLSRGWQDISIDLEELTKIKESQDSLKRFIRSLPSSVTNDPTASFYIKGNPILTRVQFFGLGITNPSEQFPNELTTTMWVDEIRLISPESRSDWAGIGTVNLILADLGTINANFQLTNPNFHQLEERFGKRTSQANWSVTMTGNLEKFAPPSFKQMKLPFTLTHSEMMETPEYVANNDINLVKASTEAYINELSKSGSVSAAQQARDNVISRSQSLKVQDSWAITGFKFGIPVNHWLINETFNKATITYSYSQEYERTPIYKERFNWQWKLGLQYGVTIPELLVVKPLSWLQGVSVLGVYSNWKINFLPSNFNTNIGMNRRRQTEQSRFLDFPSPVLRDFSAQRSYNFSWKFSEGGLLSPVIDYSVSTNSTLVEYEFDEFGRQRSGSDIANSMLFNKGQIVNFGHNNLHTQTVTINLRPQIPNFFNITKYLDITGSFATTYNWSDPMQTKLEIRDIVKNTSFSNTVRFNMGFKLKSLGDEWFGVPTTVPPGGPRKMQDTTTKKKDENGLPASLDVIKTIFFDWEKVDFVFNQQNSSVNPGVFGSTGMQNMWVGGFLGQGDDNTMGPSWAYQLGLIEQPHGGFSLASRSGFPFFGFNTYNGLRPANARLQDNFKQTTTFEIKTSRPLWTGARLDLNWKSEVGYNRNQTVVTDSAGNPTFTNIIGTETYNRTFLTFPSIFGFNPFNNTIDNVISLYENQKTVIDNQFNSKQITEVRRNQLYLEALNTAFYQGLEMFSFTGGETGKFLPAINWALRWEGLEKFSLWSSIVKRMTLDHQYTSTYQENAQITDNGRAVQTQTIQYGFQPFIGINASFDEEKFNGLLTATLRWSSSKSYQLNSVARSTVTSQSTSEITAQASYTMRGFEFPLFGFKLKNDFEVSFLFTYKSNGRTTYDASSGTGTYTGDQTQGQVLDGNTQLIVEPRARYSISSRLTASFFTRYEGTFTEGAARPGFHTVQVGFDIRLSVAGGR